MADRLTIALLEKSVTAKRATAANAPDYALLNMLAACYWATLASIAAQPSLDVEVSATLSAILHGTNG